MKKILSLFIAFHFLAGVIFLPGENFNLVSQIPDVLKVFKQVNGSLYLGEFLEEQFLGAYSIAESWENDPDEPFEKEQNPVPFNLTLSVPIAFTFTEQISIVLFPPTKILVSTPYTISYPEIDLPSVFHPPRIFSDYRTS